jgi:iron complex outermembrane receptor protein
MRALVLAWVVVLGVIVYQDSHEPERGRATTYKLHIDGQPLGPALQEFARQSGVQVIFFSEVVDGLTAPPIHGRFTRDQALDKLLSRSTLGWRAINPMTVEIRASKTPVQPHHVVPRRAVPVVE